MPPKKTTTLRATLAPLDTSQDGLLREARSQKRKVVSPTPQDEELDQEIEYLEAIHQQVERRREKMLWLAELQKKIDEAAEEMRHITQDNEQGHKPQQRDIRQESHSHDDIWYDDFHHDSIAFDDASL
jgi:nicotinamide mononucleotide adenylyltransferase